MAGDPLQKVSPGEKLHIKAETFNTFIDAARDFQERQRQIGRRGRRVPLVPGQVYVRNDTGSNRARFDIVGIAQAASGQPNIGFDPGANQLDQFKTWPLVLGQAPSPWRPFAVLVEPIAAGEVGRGTVGGVTAVRLNVLSVGHRYAEVYSTSNCLWTGTYEYLRSADCGHLILWKESGAGLKWAYVFLGVPTDEFWAKINDVTPVSANRNIYDFEEVDKTTSGYGGWVSLASSGGWAGTAYNSIEELDREIFYPPRIGEVVKMRAVWPGDGPYEPEYWFQYEVGHPSGCC